MDIDQVIAQGWDEHANDAQAVATRLAGVDLAGLSEAKQVLALAHLAHHVHGSHLGQWSPGLAFQQRLAALPLVLADPASMLSLSIYIESLKLCAGDEAGVAQLGPAERIRVGALSAASLALFDAPRAKALLEQAVALADKAGLPDKDPATRALAINGNNLAAALEEQSTQTPGERELMLLAAQTARRFWALAGTWLETERAEYRLAMCWLKAGDAARARHHATLCLRLVTDNGAVALEQFFADEALALAARAAADSDASAQALSQAEQAFARLADEDKLWCRATLEKLRS